MEAPDRLQQAYLFCDQMARQRARNFYAAFRFLPSQRRLALSAFYAYCTLSDDVADDSKGMTLEERRGKLDAWRQSLDDCFSGRAETPVFLALQDSVRKFDLPRQPFYDLLDGIEMDLEPRRYATFPDLEIYCRRVASSVGQVSVRIFGCTSSGAEVYADRLGIAFQLTNILRDLSEDLQADRLYLPLEDLERFGCTEDDLRRGLYDEHFRDLMRFEYQRAWSYYQAAYPGLAGNMRHKLFPAQIMKAVYWRVLHELERHDFKVMNRRIEIPWWRKASAVVVAAAQRLV
jgi:15-cis-phytoene synthase